MRNGLTQFFVGFIMLIIIVFYYRTELQPFQYANYDSLISLFQKHDAELDEAIVQTRFGLLKHYDAVNDALTGMKHTTEKMQVQLTAFPHENINPKLDQLISTFENKKRLTEKFKRLNPMLRNAIHDFSSLMGTIIENEAHLELIESCFDAEYRYSLIDKVNTLFKGVLVYTSAPNEAHRQNMLALIKEIREQPETLDNLERALTYGALVLDKQPALNALNLKILNVPIVSELEELGSAYKGSFDDYNDGLAQSRLFLYGLSILLLIVLHFAFKRLQDAVKKLQVEIKLKNTAQDELAESNRELEQRVADRTRDLATKNSDLNQALGDLEEAQDQLIMQEKMASVGMLTTGVAHEIKNPLNFINNFSDISVDLVDELKEELEAHQEKLGKEGASYINEILDDLKTNCSKIHTHGQHADNIVKNMLMHSQESGVQKEMVNVNALVEDNINISIRAAKSQNERFSLTVERNFEQNLDEILIAPQSIGKVLAYLLSNSYYAVEEKVKTSPDLVPLIKVTTYKEGDNLIIKIWDNGTGVPKESLKKIFEPFYTTKPTGFGNTGLGLSICYDTVVKQHKGDLSVKSTVGEFTEMTIKLPFVRSRPRS